MDRDGNRGGDGFVVDLSEVGRGDVARVGGKNASLGEMIGALAALGVAVPPGFATTTEAWRAFVREGGLEGFIAERSRALLGGEASLEETGRALRERILATPVPERVAEALSRSYRALAERLGQERPAVAVRSSATAEDLPEASFAGQHETFLHVVGEDALLEALRRCYASLFNDRAISYRRELGIDDREVALSVGVQKMVRSDLAAAGTMFTLDPETGFPDVVVIDASWGLGESVVQGAVQPDQYQVFKPALAREGCRPIIEKTLGGKARRLVYAEGGGLREEEVPEPERSSWALSDDEILLLARRAVSIERHYGCPMDVEWAKDGPEGDLYVVQARPETVQARVGAGNLTQWRLKSRGEILVRGVAVGSQVGAGRVRLLAGPGDAGDLEPGSVIVTEKTDPDWGPLLEKAAAIVTDSGGRTSHAAIVAREIGIPAIVGCGDARARLREGAEVTVSCCEGDEGRVYSGTLEFERQEVDLAALPELRTRVKLIVASPAAAFRWWRLPAKGIGLARMEFVINNLVKVHPMALLRPEAVADPEERRAIEALVSGFDDPRDFFVTTLARGLAKIAASRYPEQVIVRTSDFKTNEYAHLLGGAAFEPEEENPMIGFRGAARYDSEAYREAFVLECRALRMAREEIGLGNIAVMIPFCRTVGEADRVLGIMASQGLERGRDGLEILVMAEIPSNVFLAELFARRFDGFSIGSNDLTQLVLGVDRDSALLGHLFDARDEAVRRAIRQLVRVAHEEGVKVGICGQAPSDHPDFAAFLLECGIDSISVNPDSFVEVVETIAKLEREGG